MRVSSINTKYRPCFGYSVKANNELKKVVGAEEASKKEGTLQNSILMLQKLCIDTEDAIKKTPVITQSTMELMDVLIQSKVLLVKLIGSYYPGLKFRKLEFEHYTKQGEIQTAKGVPDEDNWQLSMAEELDEYEEDSLTESEKSEQKDFPPAVEKSSTAASSSSSSSDGSLLEEFIPNEDSPRGFIDIVGMDELKTELTETIINPLKNPEEARLDFIEYGKKYPKGVLLYGPPGCGKTYVTEALAQETGLPMFVLKISKVGAIHIHETSQNYEKVFDEVAKRANETGKPCLLFMDELDSITKNREEFDRKYELEEMATVLKLIETARSRNIIIVGATNKFNLVDMAIKRRFSSPFYIGLPDEKTRKNIVMKKLSSITKGDNLKNDSEAIMQIAKKLEGYSNDNICNIADKAAEKARRDGRRSVSAQDYYDVIDSDEIKLLKVTEQDYKPKNTAKKIGFAKEEKL